MGEIDERQKWESRTECASNGSGYDRVSTDTPYAARNTQMNQVVYS